MVTIRLSPKPAISWRKIIVVALVCLSAALVSTSVYAAANDKTFVHKAAIGNQFEIEASKIALQNSQNPDVKEFAQQMVDDHVQTGNNLQSVLANTDASAPSPSPKLDDKHQKILNKLNGMTGPEFDKQYVASQVDAHKDAISLFKEYSAHGDNSALKNFATESLPTLEQHQKEVLDLQASI